MTTRSCSMQMCSWVSLLSLFFCFVLMNLMNLMMNLMNLMSLLKSINASKHCKYSVFSKFVKFIANSSNSSLVCGGPNVNVHTQKMTMAAGVLDRLGKKFPKYKRDARTKRRKVRASGNEVLQPHDLPATPAQGRPPHPPGLHWLPDCVCGVVVVGSQFPLGCPGLCHSWHCRAIWGVLCLDFPGLLSVFLYLGSSPKTNMTSVSLPWCWFGGGGIGWGTFK